MRKLPRPDIKKKSSGLGKSSGTQSKISQFFASNHSNTQNDSLVDDDVQIVETSFKQNVGKSEDFIIPGTPGAHGCNVFQLNKRQGLRKRQLSSPQKFTNVNVLKVEERSSLNDENEDIINSSISNTPLSFKFSFKVPNKRNKNESSGISPQKKKHQSLPLTRPTALSSNMKEVCDITSNEVKNTQSLFSEGFFGKKPKENSFLKSLIEDSELDMSESRHNNISMRQLKQGIKEFNILPTVEIIEENIVNQEDKVCDIVIVNEKDGFALNSLKNSLDDDLHSLNIECPSKSDININSSVEKSKPNCSKEEESKKEVDVKGIDQYMWKVPDYENRYIVEQVNYDSTSHNVVLDAVQLHNSKSTKIILAQSWKESYVRKGEIIIVIKCKKDGNTIVIDDCNGLIVINPDLLISGTSLMSSLFCMRKGVLAEKHKSVDPSNVSMISGQILHELFQEAVHCKLQDPLLLKQKLETILKCPQTLLSIYLADINFDELVSNISEMFTRIINWVSDFCIKRKNVNISKYHIYDIKDCEENIWSPMYGIKGKIDLTVQLKSETSIPDYKVVPLELKTGKSSFSSEHRGQVMLYTLMMSDRRRETVDSGLLLYLRDLAMKEISIGINEKRGLFQLRNEVMHYLTEKIRDETSRTSLYKLPPPINNQRACSKCSFLTSCTLFLSEVENTVYPSNHSMSGLVQKSLSHLNLSFGEYFYSWCKMLGLEDEAAEKDSDMSDIWLKSPQEREERLDGIGNLVLSDPDNIGLSVSTQLLSGLFSVEFVRKDGGPIPPVFCVGDLVIVSSQDVRLLALSKGTVSFFSSCKICINMEKDMKSLNEWHGEVFRIDRVTYSGSSKLCLTNLVKLASQDTHVTKLRDIVIQKTPPTFSNGLKKECVSKCRHILRPLNFQQRKVLFKCLMANDYVLIRGMPGCGKTSTIIALVRTLVNIGHSVLITSHTHSAVDNILLKLQAHEVEFLRIGQKNRVHPKIIPHTDSYLLSCVEDLDGVRKIYESHNVVACTCLGVNHALFAKRRFDYCIMDEACQVVQPISIGPLFYASKMVLVGDPLQLPPIVRSQKARSLGMDVSLFSRLQQANSCLDLGIQYRMNSNIMAVANRLTYDGALDCADETVANRTLQLDEIKMSDREKWVQSVLDGDLSKSVMFVDTVGMSSGSSPRKSTAISQTETDIAIELLSSLSQVGYNMEEVGVIAPYRAQTRHLRESLSKIGLCGVEVNTVDQFQGRDKEVILLSCTRSHRSQRSFPTDHDVDILNDPRRLNVAITRAKVKLIVIGHSLTLRTYKPFKELLKLLNKQQYVSLRVVDDQIIVDTETLPVFVD